MSSSDVSDGSSGLETRAYRMRAHRPMVSAICLFGLFMSSTVNDRQRAGPAEDGSPSAPREQPPILYLRGVDRHYRQGDVTLEILKSADLALWPGQSVALVAPSGAGKSTLLHIAGLLEHPDAGEVYVDKIPTSRLSDAERTRIRRTELGFVYQFHHLLPEFTAVENIMLPQMIRGLSRQ